MIRALTTRRTMMVPAIPYLLALALLVTGCAATPDRAPVPGAAAYPVVIVALDGLSWQVARPLVDSGEMPQLSRLIREGAAGQLETDRPTWTPVLFTTMATGKRPEEHGINTFVSSEGIPLTSNLRRVPALWNILSRRGLPTLFFSWPVTWPAEAVRGEMISDRWHKTDQRQVHPESSAQLLSTALDTFRDQWSAPPPELVRLARLATADRVSPYLHGSFEGGDVAVPAEPDRLVRLTRKKVDTGFVWNAALDSEVKLPLFLDRLRAVRPRLSAVYFNATDMAQHFFGGADRPADGARPERNAAGREVIEETYRVYDRLLGKLIDGVRAMEGYENCIFIVLSDHGIDLASGSAVRLRPPQAVPPDSWIPFLEQAIAKTGLTGPGAPLLSDRPEENASEKWVALSFPENWPMALRSRVLNRLDLAGCRFQSADVYLYFVHNEAPPGVVVISGGEVGGGQPVRGMSVEDVTPTVLALLGLPAAEDMAGRPAVLTLRSGEQGRPGRLTAEMIPTHGSARSAESDSEAIRSPEDQTIREELQALGYIE